MERVHVYALCPIISNCLLDAGICNDHPWYPLPLTKFSKNHLYYLTRY